MQLSAAASYHRNIISIASISPSRWDPFQVGIEGSIRCELQFIDLHNIHLN